MTQAKSHKTGHQRSAGSVLSSKAAQVYRDNLGRMTTSDLARASVKEATAAAKAGRKTR